jgi:predicted ABC-type ATPase
VPDLIIIAGPNGAGKTTFANAYFREEERFAFVNADEFAHDLAALDLSEPQRDIRSARLMLERIDALAGTGVEFVFETTLASLTYAPKVPLWQQSGYHVVLIYLRLPSAEASIARVRKRVQAGGHAIPEETIRRRFARSWTYFETAYKPIVDDWYVYDSVEGDFVRAKPDWTDETEN